MTDHRQGNDLAVLWSILKDGEPFDLRGRSLKLYLKNLHERKEVVDFSVTGNKIHWTFYGKDQDTLGKHSLILVANEDEKGMITTDACDFVRLVSCSCKIQNREDAPNVETETIVLTSTLEYVAGGADYDDTALWKELENKVDKVEGFGLSEENYTAEEKEKLAGLQNYDDTAVREELKKKLSVDVVIAPTNDAQVLMSAFKTYDLANKLNVPMQCLIKKERSDQDYMLATLIVEDYRSVNAGYRLTFTMYGNKTNAMSGGKIDEQSVYSPDAQSVDNILSYLYNEQYGYVIPLGTGNTVFPNLENKVKEMLKGKVDAEKGKGLSSNDFTDENKEKLDGLENYDDSGIKKEMANKQDVYVAEYGVTTREQIKAAWEANKHIVCVYGNKLYNLTNYGDVSDIYFACVYYSVELLSLSVAGYWSKKTLNYEQQNYKVKTISESSTDTQYPSAKAVYDFVQSQGGGTTDLSAVAKWGVVTQTLKSVGNANDGYHVEVSAPQYGWIPQSFIDEVTNFGGVAETNKTEPINKPIFNVLTGYFEYRGITNLAYDEMQAAYFVGREMFGISIKNYSYAPMYSRPLVMPYKNKLRCILHHCVFNEIGMFAFFAFCSYFQFLEVGIYNKDFSSIILPDAGFGYSFYGCSSLRDIGYLNVSLVTRFYQGEFKENPSLEKLWLKGLKTNVDIDKSPLLAIDCILYMISNANASSVITITLHPTAHARAIADESIVTALEAHPNITLASA